MSPIEALGDDRNYFTWCLSPIETLGDDRNYFTWCLSPIGTLGDDRALCKLIILFFGIDLNAFKHFVASSYLIE